MASSLCHDSFHVSGTYSAPELGVYCGWAAFKEEVADSVVMDRDVRLFWSGECFPNDASQIGAETPPKQKATVELYRNQGPAFLDELNGIFSGLLIDERSKTSYLFNDRYGLERIYCHRGKDAFYFASEAKALLRVLPELRRFDDNGVRDFLNFGCTIENRTLFNGVELLPGGSVWTFANRQQTCRKYFSPDEWEAQPQLAPEAFESEFEQALERIVPRYWSRRRVAVSLTAGLDSRMILAFRQPFTIQNFVTRSLVRWAHRWTPKYQRNSLSCAA